MLNKIVVRTLKPRNPLVLASRRRHAGLHRAGPGARRQQAEHRLRKEIGRLRDGP